MKKTLMLLLPLFAGHAIAGDQVPLLIFAGQSNMVGYRTDVSDLTTRQRAEQPDVWFYGPNDDGTTWEAVDLGKRPTQITQTVKGRGFGEEGSVGRSLVESRTLPEVAMVKYVVNGAPDCSFMATHEQARAGQYPPGISRSWNVSIPHGNGTTSDACLYIGLVKKVREAQAAFERQFGKKTYIAGLFWMQGESDAQNETTARAYGQNFRNFIMALRTDLGAPDMPVVYGRIRHAGLFPFDTVVRSEQDALADPGSSSFLPHVACVDTDDCEMFSAIDPKAGDGPAHYSSQGTMKLGEKMAAAFQSLTNSKTQTNEK